MKRAVALTFVLGLGCVAPPAPKPLPILSDLLCPEPTASPPITRLPPEERWHCIEALAPRIEALKHTILRRWAPAPNPSGFSAVQLQFGLDAEGRLVDVCVLGGTGDAEARSALAAVKTYRPPTPLSAAEKCVLGDPLVSTFTTENPPPP